MGGRIGVRIGVRAIRIWDESHQRHDLRATGRGDLVSATLREGVRTMGCHIMRIPHVVYLSIMLAAAGARVQAAPIIYEVVGTVGDPGAASSLMSEGDPFRLRRRR
jgi:hypothetical protein